MHNQEENIENHSDFTFAIHNPGNAPSSADDLFDGGFIRPVYPVFNRNLILDELNSTAELEKRKSIGAPEEGDGDLESGSSSEDEGELEGVPDDSYCVWVPKSAAPPSPGACKKSKSTGSSLRWKLKDLVLGRSQSDGKERFAFLEESKGAPSTTEKGAKAKGKSVKVSELDLVTAHRIFYGKRGKDSGGARRSYLPYKPEIVGLFSNVHGLGRSQN